MVATTRKKSPIPKGLDNGPRPKNREKAAARLDRVYRGDASQPGDGVGNGGIAERNKVAEDLVTGLAPLPTKAGDRAAEILAGEQGPYGGAPHQSGGVGSVAALVPADLMMRK